MANERLAQSLIGNDNAIGPHKMSGLQSGLKSLSESIGNGTTKLLESGKQSAASAFDAGKHGANAMAHTAQHMYDANAPKVKVAANEAAQAIKSGVNQVKVKVAAEYAKDMPKMKTAVAAAAAATMAGAKTLGYRIKSEMPAARARDAKSADSKTAFLRGERAAQEKDTRTMNKLNSVASQALVDHGEKRYKEFASAGKFGDAAEMRAYGKELGQSVNLHAVKDKAEVALAQAGKDAGTMASAANALLNSSAKATATEAKSIIGGFAESASANLSQVKGGFADSVGTPIKIAVDTQKAKVEKVKTDFKTAVNKKVEDTQKAIGYKTVGQRQRESSRAAFNRSEKY
jgi:hypothetical protein